MGGEVELGKGQQIEGNLPSLILQVHSFRPGPVQTTLQTVLLGPYEHFLQTHMLSQKKNVTSQSAIWIIQINALIYKQGK